jgi:hypothetical protein
MVGAVGAVGAETDGRGQGETDLGHCQVRVGWCTDRTCGEEGGLGGEANGDAQGKTSNFPAAFLPCGMCGDCIPCAALSAVRDRVAGPAGAGPDA